MPPLLTSRPCEITRRVQMCGDKGLVINGEVKKPDVSKAYVEFHLSHGFPVTTSDGTAIHPQVVANSYESLTDQVFNLGHYMRAYRPQDIPRDRMLGSVVGVEFPDAPEGGWTVQADRARAPGIRGVAVLHKNAEDAPRVLAEQSAGRRPWTVSMETQYYIDDSGFLVATAAGPIKELAAHAGATPPDLRELGYTYVPAPEAPASLRACYQEQESRVTGKWQGREVICLLGGLDHAIHYNGVGLASLGKEPEAEVARMLAGGCSVADLEGALEWQIVEALKKTALLADWGLRRAG